MVVLKSYGQEKGSVGLARLVQATPTQCIVEATIDGLPEGKYQVNVHEYGDMSQGCQRLENLLVYFLNWDPLRCIYIVALDKLFLPFCIMLPIVH